jgi:hypothetical protein
MIDSREAGNHCCRNTAVKRRHLLLAISSAQRDGETEALGVLVRLDAADVRWAMLPHNRTATAAPRCETPPAGRCAPNCSSRMSTWHL